MKLRHITTKSFIAVIMFALLATACQKEGHYNLSELPPLEFKSYYDGLNVTFANQTKGATAISWDFGDGSAAATGDSLQHSYSKTGNYLIAMSGTYQGKPYVFHTVLKVDKPSAIKLDDNTFADWDNVVYPDFQLSGKDNVLGGKIDYDANNIYFYIEWSTTGTNGLATLTGAIMDLYLDVDNDVTTGYSSVLGAEYLYEGNIPTSWFDFYQFTGAKQADWTWTTVFIPNSVMGGHTETDGETVKMEFAISREKFNIMKDAFGFQLIMNFSDWSGEIGSLTKDNYTRIHIDMNKQ